VLSLRLIERIERNWEKLSAVVLEDVRSDPRGAHYQALSDQEILERAQDLVKNLGFWLTQRNPEQLKSRYERLGARRAAQGVPLAEVILALQVLKRRIMYFARDLNMDQTAIELYRENELLMAIEFFFDEAIYNVAIGYNKPHVKASHEAA
jgi:hypothetical protein